MNRTLLIHRLREMAAMILLLVALYPGMASAQSFPDSLFRIIYGNKDRSPIITNIGQTIEIPVWGITPAGDYMDSITEMWNPLATDDSMISRRLAGSFPDTLVGTWDMHSFEAAGPDTSSGWTNQTMLGISWLMGPVDPQNYFWTNGDTVLICTFIVQVGWDTSLIGNTVYPFRSGVDQNNGSLLWGEGIEQIVPKAVFSPLYFPTLCSYIPGDLNGDGVANGLDIVFAVCYCKNICHNPPADCSAYCPGTPHPYYAAGDVNGNCAFNGIDLTFFVRYLKGQVSSLLYCADCPPAQ
jgi:hypothetical protein